ncbi:MAG: S46 family peptidase [Steroidobacteraceae bacterium]
MTTPVSFTNNQDILGNNSGSPMLNAAGDIVGLAMNRSIGMHPAYIRLALDKVYGAKAVLEDMR